MISAQNAIVPKKMAAIIQVGMTLDDSIGCTPGTKHTSCTHHAVAMQSPSLANNYANIQIYVIFMPNNDVIRTSVSSSVANEI